MLRLALLCIGLAALSAPLCAELIERAFPGKTEADVARDFEAGLTDFFAARAKEADRPRVRVEINKKAVYLEVVELKDGELVWAELICHGWYEEKLLYGYTPGESRVKFKAADIPPMQVARCFNVPYRVPSEIVALAAWLAGKGQVMAANAKLAELHKLQEAFKPDIEAWLKGKHGWASESILQVVNTHDLREFQEGLLLLTAEAAMERLKLLDAEAKAALKELQTQQGGDIKSVAGARKNPPTIRLDTLQSRIERFSKAYGGTVTAEHKGSRKILDELLAAVKADRAWTEAQGFKADRLKIEGDQPACADGWVALLKADPENPILIQKAAMACHEAVGRKDNDLKCVRPEKALKAAELWEKMSEIWPLMLNARNYAGVNYMAAGKKDKAKANFEEVLRRTEKKDISDGEKQHREYAQVRLKIMASAK